MEDSKNEQLKLQQEQQLKIIQKQEKMRCIEIASRLHVNNSKEVVAEAEVLYQYLNR